MKKFRRRYSLLEQLESRRLLSFSVVTPIAPVTVTDGTPTSNIPLAGTFDDPTITGTVVQFTFQYKDSSNNPQSIGKIIIGLDDSAAPITVANFLNYVTTGAYDNTIIHRAADYENSVVYPNGTPFVIQGGGYLNASGLPHITTADPITNEFSASRPNVRGTIAMAKGDDPNSATSEWFINLSDNSTALDNPANAGGFTVFGQVLGSGMTVADGIYALPKSNIGGGLTTVPFAGDGSTIFNNLVTASDVSVVPEFTYNQTVTSSNTALVTGSISGSTLSLNYNPGHSGSANITVSATDALGNVQSDQFTVNVQSAANLSVTNNNNPVTDNQPSPIGFATVAQNATAPVQHFTLTNTGDITLHFSAPTLPAGFTSTTSLTTLAPGASIDYAVSMSTTTAGAKSGTLIINSDDPDSPAFHIPLAGTVTFHAINVSLNGNAITDGQATVIDYGNLAISSTAQKTFTITNTGTDALTLGTVTVPTGFMNLSTLPPTLAAGASTNLIIGVDTSVTATRSGNVTIASNDPQHSLFSFPVAAHIVVAPNLSLTLNGTVINDNQAPISFGTFSQGLPATETFTITNNGGNTLHFGAISIPDGFIWTDPLTGTFPNFVPNLTTLAPNATVNFTVALITATPGTKSGTLTIASDDLHSPFHLNLTGTVTFRAINVSVDSNTLTNNQSTSIDFGTNTLGSTLQKTFVVSNSGNEALAIGTVTVPTGFNIVTALPDTIAPGDQANLVIGVDTSAAGVQAGTISIANNDLTNGPFNFPVTATVTAPQIGITLNSNPLTNGTSSIDFGQAFVSAADQQTLTISNTGNGLLTFGALTPPAGFTVVQALPATLAPNATASLILALDTTSIGAKSGTLVIASNDPTNTSFQISLTGQVNYLPVTVSLNGTALTSGASTIDFGQVFQSDTQQRTLVVTNPSLQTLTFGAATISNGFSIVQNLPNTLAPGASANLIIALDTSNRGTQSGTLTIPSNDLLFPSFQIALNAQVVYRGISISTNGSPVIFGSATPINLGRTAIGSSVQQTFTVSNLALANPLTITGVTVPAGYSIVQNLPATLAAGASADLIIALDTATTGVRNGNLIISSSDLDKPQFNVPLTASVVLPVTLGAGGASSVVFTDADGTTATLKLSGPGSAELDFAGDGVVATPGKKGSTVSGTNVSLVAAVLSSTTTASKFTITTKGGNNQIDLGDLTAAGSVNSITAKTVHVTGTVSLGGVRTLSFGIIDGATLNIGAASGAPTIAFTQIVNGATITGGSIKSLKTASWSGGGSISAASIATLTISTGNFDAALTLTSAAQSLGNASIKGAISTGAWNISGAVGKLTAGSVSAGWSGTVAGAVSNFTVTNFSGTLVAGALTAFTAKGSVTSASITGNTIGKVSIHSALSDTHLLSNGNITSISAGSIAGSVIYAGIVPSDGALLPSTLAEFVVPAQVGTLTAKSFVNSAVAARFLGKISITTITTNNNGQPEGFAADTLASMKGKLDTGATLKLSNVTDAATLAAQLTADKVSQLNDLSIILV